MKNIIALLVSLAFLSTPTIIEASPIEQEKVEQQVQAFMAKEDIPALAIGII